jgi:methylmalonyl-CoA/ethylmalonyl-CoA epimerase
MKAVLDHVGIAVDRLDEALAFYRDALGLDVSVPEDVPTQKVRAHMLGTGPAALELLEATASDSPIATFVGKRGPGLHHVTLRVEDLPAALRELAARGVRLIDSAPRSGAHGSQIAFIHPSATHGVLVELKQAPPLALKLATASIPWGDLTLTTLHDGPFRLDGGAMFGVVPKPLWEKLSPADDRNRIQMAMRPLLVESSWGRMLVDCGVGGKMPDKARDIYALDRTVHLDHALAEHGLDAAAIDFALATHLHFDHFGGATMRGPGGAGAALSERPLPDSRRRMGRRHAPARAEPRQLSAGRLRAAEAGGCRRFLCGRHHREAGRSCRANRRAHRPASDRLSRIRREDGGVRRGPRADHVSPAGPVGDGLRPVSHGGDGLQETVPPRGDRPRIPGVLRARPGRGRGFVRERDGKRWVEQVL